MWTVRHRLSLRGQGGFTLIEMLVVIALLSIVAGVVVMAMGGITTKANDSACSAERHLIETAIEAYHIDFEAFPATLGDLVSSAPHYLKREPPASRWTFTPNTDEFVGIGRCTGYSSST